MKAKLSTNLYAGCPNCGNAHAFNLHERILKERRFRSWSCDNCHHVYDGKLDDSGDWELTHTGVHQPTLLLLSLPPQQKPVYFVVENMVYAGHGDPLGTADREDHNRFRIEENSSLTNHIGCEQVLSVDGDLYSGANSGLLKYVGEIDRRLCGGGKQPVGVDYMKAFSHLVPDLKATAEDLGAFDDDQMQS